MIEWFTNLFVSTKVNLDRVDSKILKAYEFAKIKLEHDPSSQSMTTKQKELEILEWTAHYLREIK